MHVLMNAEGTGWEESARLAVAAGFHRNGLWLLFPGQSL